MGNVALSWREIFPTLPRPLSPLHPLPRPSQTVARRGRSLSWWPEGALFSPPSPSPLGANGGVGGDDSWASRTPSVGNPEGAPCSTPASVSPPRVDRSAPKRARPRPGSPKSLQVQTLTQLPLRLEASGPATAGALGGCGNCRPREGPGPLLFAAPGLSALCAPQYLCSVAGSALPPC